MSISQRRSPRYLTSLCVSWIVGAQFRPMIGMNANAHGLFLRTDEGVIPGALMQIEVSLPDGPQRFIVIARFVGDSLDGRGVGVEFFVANDPARRAWMRFIESLRRGTQLAQASSSVGGLTRQRLGADSSAT